VQETNGTFLVGGVAAVVGSVQAGGYFTVCDETFDLFGFPVGGGGVEARGSAADFEFFFGKIEAACSSSEGFVLELQGGSSAAINSCRCSISIGRMMVSHVGMNCTELN